MKRLLLITSGIACALWFAQPCRASVNFDVAGLGGTGVTAEVGLAFTSWTNNLATLTMTIQNTSTVEGNILGFAFNVPAIDGVAISKIGGATPGGSSNPLSPWNAVVIPEGSMRHQSGWHGKWASDSINTLNGAGDFDYGVLNANHAPNFIEDGSGSGPKISNRSDHNDWTAFALTVEGSGMQSIANGAIESAFLNEFSSGRVHYNFALLFEKIGGSNLSDTAVPFTAHVVTPVPVPGAMVLAAVGLGVASMARGRRKDR